MMLDTGKQLSSFLKLASKNKRIKQSHLSLYGAILMCCTQSHCHNPFRVTRSELMKHSAIRSFATYHKCIKELMIYDYIDYQPSFHPHLASQITLLNDNEPDHKKHFEREIEG
ncbi:hypothetical protein HDF26_001860 [Pedobacter cryoconitis]|uniref:hypothetical protein n=1 Tax=Pedobacter cryoconitis TaxID=188932 RepID=UPI001620F080|nr:hypothetical protein [Pedobacter cryoconitis]MBB6271433.1 hypothetical protein [Pedobacter cryoconitis]